MSYTITSVRDSGTITYHCATIEGAIEKIEDFRHADYRDIRVTTDGAEALSERLLASLAERRKPSRRKVRTTAQMRPDPQPRPALRRTARRLPLGEQSFA